LKRLLKNDLEIRVLGFHLTVQRIVMIAVLVCLLVLAILMVFLMHYAGLFSVSSTPGLIVLLLLAFTAVLAGVHFNWRMAVVGLILGATFVAAVMAEEYFWYLIVAAFVTAVAIFVLRRKSE
jgi:hypothetical protein